MEAWRDNKHIDFNFFDAHDINTARDTSLSETIRRRLSERMSNAKQAVVLVSATTRPKSARISTFLAYEMQIIARRNVPVVFASLNGSRSIQRDKLPEVLINQYSVCVSFQPTIIKYALDNYVQNFNSNIDALAKTVKSCPHYYKEDVYRRLGL